jgi:hypothetical protein
MNEERITASPSWSDPRVPMMKTPDDVAGMLRLKACGCGLACPRDWDGQPSAFPPSLAVCAEGGRAAN